VSNVSRQWTAVVAAAALAVGVGLATPIAPAWAQGLQAGAEAPDFTRTDLAGQSVRLSNYRGKVVLLTFWATWCPPCLDEIPAFSGWQQKYGASGLQVLAISMDDSSTPVKSAVGKYHVIYPVVMSDEKLVELYGGVLGLPLNFIIDPSGRIVARHQGKTDLKAMESQIKSLLPGAPPAGRSTSTPADSSASAQYFASPDAALKNFPFSEAVRAGDFLFVSGQVGIVPGSDGLAPGGIGPESTQALENMRAVLERHGSSLQQVVKCTVFLADMHDWPAFNDVYRQYFKAHFPARSAFGANGLALGARVELDCTAFVPH
jgi:2-iminobutanoate/2-iminopropanoate deaminase